jgi:hypothetical protein
MVIERSYDHGLIETIADEKLTEGSAVGLTMSAALPR